MGIRQTMNENPALSIGVTAGAILVAIIIIIWELVGGKSPTSTAAINQSFFTDDDGKTFFADDANKIPPFMHNGKPAYKVLVFKCKDGKPFVAHMERYTEEGKKRLEDTKQTRGRLAQGMGAFMEVKKPGQPTWVRMTGDNPRAWSEIMRVTCPDGGAPEPVFPGQQ